VLLLALDRYIGARYVSDAFLAEKDKADGTGIEGCSPLAADKSGPCAVCVAPTVHSSVGFTRPCLVSTFYDSQALTAPCVYGMEMCVWQDGTPGDVNLPVPGGLRAQPRAEDAIRQG